MANTTIRHAITTEGQGVWYHFHTEIMRNKDLEQLTPFARNKFVDDRSRRVLSTGHSKTEIVEKANFRSEAANTPTIFTAIQGRMDNILGYAASQNKRIALLFDEPSLGEMVIFYALKEREVDFDLIINTKKQLPGDDWYDANIVDISQSVIPLPATDKAARIEVLAALHETHVVLTGHGDYCVNRPDQYMYDMVGWTEEYLREPYGALLENINEQNQFHMKNLIALYQHDETPIESVQDFVWWFLYIFKWQPEQFVYPSNMGIRHSFDDTINLSPDAYSYYKGGNEKYHPKYNENYHGFFNSRRFSLLGFRLGLQRRFADQCIFEEYLESVGANLTHINTYNGIISANYTLADLEKYNPDPQHIYISGVREFLSNWEVW